MAEILTPQCKSHRVLSDGLGRVSRYKSPKTVLCRVVYKPSGCLLSAHIGAEIEYTYG